jgi:hypothetical protein
MTEKKIKGITESTWGASFEDMSEHNPYPFWSGNDIQRNLNNLENLLSFGSSALANTHIDSNESSTQPLWFYESVHDITESTKLYLKTLILSMKFEHSDKYWWASKKSILGNPMLFHPGMVEKALAYASLLAENVEDTKIKEEALSLIGEITAMLKS